jgi:hypothetical protein
VDTDVTEMADQAYAIRILDAPHDEHAPAIREYDYTHLF